MELVGDILPKFVKAKEYLIAKADTLPVYRDLAEAVERAIANLSEIKPKLKFVSRDLALCKQLKAIATELEFELQVVSIEREIKHILYRCELLVLVCHTQQPISLREQLLIHRAKAQNVLVAMAIVGKDRAEIDRWQSAQIFFFEPETVLASVLGMVFENAEAIAEYRRNLARLLFSASLNLEARLGSDLSQAINRQIGVFKQQKWQSIQQQKLGCSRNLGIEPYRQQVNQLMQKLTKRQQHFVGELKQELNAQKASLLNPFRQDSLICRTQEIIRQAEISIVKEEKEAFLVPFTEDSKNFPLYLADLYQTKLQSHLLEEWHKCQCIYGDGGFEGLRREIERELEFVAESSEATIEPKTDAVLEFSLSKLAYLPILETGSRLKFDYHFSDSKWCRLSIAVLVGIIIFVATKLLFGEGRFFGFVIIIFQVINLFTGQDAKTLKLKQQTKELKRILENKYQVLIRLSVEKITRDLILAVEKEHRYYQQQCDRLNQQINEKLLGVKNNIEVERQQIEQLQQDREKIISILTD